jgi:hypothetical protein
MTENPILLVGKRLWTNQNSLSGPTGLWDGYNKKGALFDITRKIWYVYL